MACFFTFFFGQKGQKRREDRGERSDDVSFGAEKSGCGSSLGASRSFGESPRRGRGGQVQACFSFVCVPFTTISSSHGRGKSKDEQDARYIANIIPVSLLQSTRRREVRAPWYLYFPVNDCMYYYVVYPT